MFCQWLLPLIEQKWMGESILSGGWQLVSNKEMKYNYIINDTIHLYAMIVKQKYQYFVPYWRGIAKAENYASIRAVFWNIN